jgi:hypothetical protein
MTEMGECEIIEGGRMAGYLMCDKTFMNEIYSLKAA